MNTLIYVRLSILAVVTFVSSLTYAQTNAEKIKAKWVVEKFETEKNTPQAIQAKQDLEGSYLAFEKDELTITKKTGSGESLIKRGQYLVLDNSLTLGKDQATILELSEKHLTIQIPNQGILYLAKM